jgi:hypothetical protein
MAKLWMRTKGRTTKRVLVLLALTMVGALASVSAAQARVVTNETVSYSWSGFVDCANGGAGELVNGRIDVHNLVTSNITDNVYSSTFQFQPHGSLVGTITGDTYQLTGLTRRTYVESLQSDTYTLTYVSSYQLIGPGPENNLRVREIAHITGNGNDVVVHHGEWTIECT